MLSWPRVTSASREGEHRCHPVRTAWRAAHSRSVRGPRRQDQPRFQGEEVSNRSRRACCGACRIGDSFEHLVGAVLAQPRCVAPFRSDEEDAHLACERIGQSPGVAQPLERVVTNALDVDVFQDPDFVLVGAHSCRHRGGSSPRFGAAELGLAHRLVVVRLPDAFTVRDLQKRPCHFPDVHSHGSTAASDVVDADLLGLPGELPHLVCIPEGSGAPRSTPEIANGL